MSLKTKRLSLFCYKNSARAIQFLKEFLKRFKMQEKISAKLVSKYIKASGFRSKAEFARLMGLNVNTISLWGEKTPLPPYFFQVLQWAKKAKKYDELMKEK